MSAKGNGRLEGKVAIVTGGGQGIGAAICARYAAEGAAVVVADVNGDNASKVADEISGNGGKAVAATADVSDADSVQQLVDGTVKDLGSLDVMVNNAAITVDAMLHVLEADEAWWDKIVDTNLKGHFLCSLAAAHHMVRKGTGTIITTSSGGGSRSHRGMVAYDASKGGIEAMTRALALDLAPYGIRVVGLVPGLIVHSREDADEAALARTDATVPLGRAGLPDDLAGPAVFLASDDARYITGSLVTVDGGVLFQQRPPQVEVFPLERFPDLPNP